jgi:hypothetical protein
MKYVSTIFGQMLDMLPRGEFDRDVAYTQADRYTKHYTAWNQLLVNLYAQATGKKSLRDIETGLKMHQSLWYHWGLENAARSTISYANQKRSWELSQRVFYCLLEKCRDVSPTRRFRFKNPLKALDSTTIELCLSVFPWAKFRTKKGALKLHTLLDIRGTVPEFITVSEGALHDVKAARSVFLPLSPDSIVTFDKAYTDFAWLYWLHCRKVFFVTRAKDNLCATVVGQHTVGRSKGVIADEIIEMRGPLTRKKYPEQLRRVTYYDEKKDRLYKFLTNNFTLAASTIAHIYKARWEIETFFKWIKQNLKIKTFLGTSVNAVLTQVWTAMSYYLLLTYIKYQTKYKNSLLYLTRVIRECVCRRADIIDLLNLSLERVIKLRDPCQQLTLL